MTITEAVALVLQASTLAFHGEIYMRDMGNPVMIASLACKLVEMSGLRPDYDVPIHTIGIRPGERLHEQLWYEGANVSETEFPRVYSVAEETAPPDLGEQVEELEHLARARRNAEVMAALEALPISYKRLSQEKSSVHYSQNRPLGFALIR